MVVVKDTEDGIPNLLTTRKILVGLSGTFLVYRGCVGKGAAPYCSTRTSPL